MLANGSKVPVPGKELQIVLNDVLRDNQIGDADAIDSVADTGDLHLPDVAPVNINGISLDFPEQSNQTLLTANMKGWDELRKNEVICDNKILVDEIIKDI